MTEHDGAIGFAITEPYSDAARWRAATPAAWLRGAGNTVVVSDVLRATPSGTLALGLQMPSHQSVMWEPDTMVLANKSIAMLDALAIDNARAGGQHVIGDLDEWPLPAELVERLAHVELVTTAYPHLARHLRDALPTVPVLVARGRSEWLSVLETVGAPS